MAECILQVPLVGQMTPNDVKEKDYDGVMRRPGENGCWYAAACMVAYYYEAGPRFGYPDVWKWNNQGLAQSNYYILAEAEGFMDVPRPCWHLTSKHLIELLKTHGPIWAAGKFGGNGGEHAIVITGIRNKTVFYNDPWEPMAKQATDQWIHANLQRSKYAMMAKAPGKKIRPPFLKPQ
jgi:hypothetical protein